MSASRLPWTTPARLPRRCESTVDYLARVYGIAPIEYPGRGEASLLLCAGTGLMLSLMDQCPRLRWCLDVDGLAARELTRLPDWAACMRNLTDLIAVAGWYCSTNPLPLARAYHRLGGRGRVPCYVQCHGPGDDPFDDARTAHALEDFVAQVNTMEIAK